MRRRFSEIAFLVAVAVFLTLGFSGCEIYPPLGAGSFSTVVIDAGHGGLNSGAKAYRGAREKELTLDVAKRLEKNLRARGFRVIMTRDVEKFVGLDQRVAVSNRTGGCIFVSIHFNWAPYQSAHGTETFFYTERSQRLAANIQKELVGTLKTSNRGVKQRGFYVLRKNAKPSVLVECCFVSNPAENGMAQSGSWRQKMAEAIARGIANERKGVNPYR